MTEQKYTHELVYYGEPEAANFIGVSVDTLRRWRDTGIGPAWHECVGGIIYRFIDLDDWMRAVSTRKL